MAKEKSLPFILNDESVTNTYGFKILTSGISLGRFRTNPIMLNAHHQTNDAVLGNWKDIQVKEGLLSATPEFDLEDEDAKKIAGKVERGKIKGASMGVSFSPDDLVMQEGTLTLTACELWEASIVPIPSNSAALRLYADGKLLSQNDITELCLSASKQQTTPKQRQIMNKITLSPKAILALGVSSDSTEMAPEALNTHIVNLGAKLSAAALERDTLKAQVDSYVQKEKDVQAQLSADLIDGAIKAGKITADKKQAFVDLAIQNFDLAKSTLDALPAKRNFSAGIEGGSGGTALTMEDFQKLSTVEQVKFKTNNPEEYTTLLASL